MGQHFESVSRFRLRRQAAGFNYLEDLDDMWSVQAKKGQEVGKLYRNVMVPCQ